MIDISQTPKKSESKQILSHRWQSKGNQRSKTQWLLYQNRGFRAEQVESPCRMTSNEDTQSSSKNSPDRQG